MKKEIGSGRMERRERSGAWITGAGQSVVAKFGTAYSLGAGLLLKL
jgi:hypothetical protein